MEDQQNLFTTDTQKFLCLRGGCDEVEYYSPFFILNFLVVNVIRAVVVVMQVKVVLFAVKIL